MPAGAPFALLTGMKVSAPTLEPQENRRRAQKEEPQLPVGESHGEVGADALLKCEMVAGHGGVSGRYNAWEQRAFELAWLLDVVGLAD